MAAALRGAWRLPLRKPLRPPLAPLSSPLPCRPPTPFPTAVQQRGMQLRWQPSLPPLALQALACTFSARWPPLLTRAPWAPLPAPSPPPCLSWAACRGQTLAAWMAWAAAAPRPRQRRPSHCCCRPLPLLPCPPSLPTRWPLGGGAWGWGCWPWPSVWRVHARAQSQQARARGPSPPPSPLSWPRAARRGRQGRALQRPAAFQTPCMPLARLVTAVLLQRVMRLGLREVRRRVARRQRGG